MRTNMRRVWHHAPRRIRLCQSWCACLRAEIVSLSCTQPGGKTMVLTRGMLDAIDMSRNRCRIIAWPLSPSCCAARDSFQHDVVCRCEGAAEQGLKEQGAMRTRCRIRDPQSRRRFRSRYPQARETRIPFVAARHVDGSYTYMVGTFGAQVHGWQSEIVWCSRQGISRRI